MMELLGKLSGNNVIAVTMVRQSCLDDNGWLNVTLTIVSVNGRHF